MSDNREQNLVKKFDYMMANSSNTYLVSEFGEKISKMVLTNMGYDFSLDEKGTRLAKFEKDGRIYGVCVKTRNAKKNNNKTLALKCNEIIRTYEKAKGIDLIPAYMIVWYTKEGIDMICITHEHLLKYKGFESFKSYKEKMKSISFSASQDSRNEWVNRYNDEEEGIIFAARREYKV